MTIIKSLRQLWEEKPLLCILFAGGFFRLLAVIFSKGYGMHDDHFLVIEASQSWIDGYDYNKWLPTITKGLTKPTGHSLLYPGLHYFLFHILQLFGLNDPQGKMYIVRLLHGALSMTIVYMSYKMALKAGGLKAAKMAGLLTALLFFMPMMSVRNLIEFVCATPLLYATWLVFREDNPAKNKPYFLAGLLLGLALSVRFQTLFFSAGFGLALLLQKRWKPAILLAIGIFSGLMLVQGITDMIIWHKPFMEMIAYVQYNMENATTYGVQKWYNYLLLLSGILIPPISLFLFFGFLRSWKKYLILFLPAFIFLVAHSAFPNKQERFILPIVPLFITLGAIGWSSFHERSAFWHRNTKLYRGCWIFFWSINLVPLLFVSTAYSHRNRVESMTYLSEQKDFHNMIIEESNHDYCTMPPLFYLKHWVHYFEINTVMTFDSLSPKILGLPVDSFPNYVVFNQVDNIEARVANFKKRFPKMEYMTTIQPGFVDKVMHRINWHNANFTSYIYRLNGRME